MNDDDMYSCDSTSDQSSTEIDESTSQIICNICLEEIENDEILKPCLCNRCVHKECLVLWLQSSGRKSCEICNFQYRIEKQIKIKRLSLKSFSSHFYKWHIFYIYILVSLLFALMGDQGNYLKYIYSFDEIRCYTLYSPNGIFVGKMNVRNYYTSVVNSNDYLNILSWQDPTRSDLVGIKLMVLGLTSLITIVTLFGLTFLLNERTKIYGVEKQIVGFTICITSLFNITYQVLGYSQSFAFSAVNIKPEICPEYLELRYERNEWLKNSSINFGTWTIGYLIFMDSLFLLTGALATIIAVLQCLILFYKACQNCIISFKNKVKERGCIHVCCKCCFKEEEIILNVV